MGIDISAERNERTRVAKKTGSKKPQHKPVIDCQTCKTGTMEATKIGKFGGFLRFIGYIIVIPSVLGVLLALVTFFSVGAAATDPMITSADDGVKVGVAIGVGLGVGFALFIGISSLVGGLIGWLLLMKKKVFKCVNCGFILDRA